MLRLAAPLVVSFCMRAAFSFVDTAYAATIGDAAVAAIGLTIPFEFLMIAVWVGLSTGLTSCLSRAMGAREGRKIEQYLRVGWVLVLAVAPFFTAIGAGIWALAPRLSLDEAVARSFAVYGTVLVAGSSFTLFWSVIPDSVVKAHQDTRSTMWAGIVSNLINVALNTLFTFVFHWGVFGIALSTVIGRIGGLAYASSKARAHEARRQASGDNSSARTDPSPYRSILSLAVPSALTFALMAVETAVINALLARVDHPTEAIAAHSIYYRVVLFALNPIIAAGVALLPYTARRLGESDLEGVRRGMRESTAAATIYSIAVVAPMMALLGPWLARSLAEAPLTARYAVFAMRIVPFACLFGAPFLLCRPVFEGLGRGRPGLWMATLRYAVLTVPFAWGGARIAHALGFPGLYGLLLGTLAATGVSSAVFYAWVRTALGSLALPSAAESDRIRAGVEEVPPPPG